MRGHIQYRASRNRYRVVWYDEKAHRHRFVYQYRGHVFACSAFLMKGGKLVLDKRSRPVPDEKKCTGYKLANKLLTAMQGRYEQANRGECVFRMEEFTKDGWTDTIEYYHRFIDDFVAKRRKPATVKAYRSYARTWVEPFFTKHPVRLHEVEYDTLTSFLNYILNKLRKKNPDPEANIGKTALNIMSTFKKMMEYARKSKRINVMPPFPSLEDYSLQKPDIDWLTREDWDAVFNKVPEDHRPIFLWVHLHYRRLGEACALHKVDYDPFTGCFVIHRSVSARKLVHSVKTNWKKPTIHYKLCHPIFTPIAKQLLNKNLDSPFLFVNPRARKDGKRYSLEALRNVWYQACDDAEIRRIWPYKGLKHTACTNFLEEGGNIDDLQILTGHARRESVEQYAEITMDKQQQVQDAAIERQKEAMKKTMKEPKKGSAEGAQVILLPEKP